MGKISPPHKVKLFVGMLSSDTALFEELKGRLQDIFGPVDLEGPVWSWAHTKYYEKEMGAGLKRQFIFFERLINPGEIAEIKLKTIDLENKYLNENPPLPPFAKGGMDGYKGGRRINLDPGYLDTAKLVLASTKDFSHRIYLDKGIYAEVTLMYSGNSYQTLPFTFPDYRTGEYLELFKKARGVYKGQS